MAAHAGRRPVDPQGDHPTLPLRDRVRKARAARARPGGRPRAVERAINEADPIGLLAGGAASDEYAPEIGTIIPLLANAHRADDVTAVLHGEFLRWFGEGTAGPRQAYGAPERATVGKPASSRHHTDERGRQASKAAIARSATELRCSSRTFRNSRVSVPVPFRDRDFARDPDEGRAIKASARVNLRRVSTLAAQPRRRIFPTSVVARATARRAGAQVDSLSPIRWCKICPHARVAAAAGSPNDPGGPDPDCPTDSVAVEPVPEMPQAIVGERQPSSVFDLQDAIDLMTVDVIPSEGRAQGRGRRRIRSV